MSRQDENKKRKRTKKDIRYNVIMTVLVLIFLGSGATLVRDYLRSQKQDAALAEISAIFPEAAMPEVSGSVTQKNVSKEEDGEAASTAGLEMPAVVSPQEWKQQWEQIANGRFASYQTLKTKNSDMVGWIRIEGTKVDYPVLQTPDDPEYYLHRDFNRQSSNYGIPFMEAASRYEEPRTGILIYGHHMRNGSMFAALNNYTKESYYREHPYVQFDTLDRAGSYEIVAAVKVDASSDMTPWKELLFAKSKEEFDQAWRVFQNQMFYPTGAELEYGNQLLALVTCEYTLKDGRIMVVAREIP